MEFRQAEIRQEIIDELKKELMGPREEYESLKEVPTSVYIAGVLHPESEKENKVTDENPIQMESDKLESEPEREESNSESTEDDEPDDANMSKSDDSVDDDFNLRGNIKINQSSIGFNFFINSFQKELNVTSSWGRYSQVNEEYEKEGKDDTKKKSSKKVYKREPVNHILKLDISSSSGSHELEDGVFLEYVKRGYMNSKFSVVSIFLVNRKESVGNNDWQENLYQAKLGVKGVFYNEFMAKSQKEDDDYLFRERPVYARGYGCAVNWVEGINSATEIATEFIPEHEIPSVSPEIDGLNLSMKKFGYNKSENQFEPLYALARLYEDWIKELGSFENEKVRERAISNCTNALERLKRGIGLLESNSKAKDAFSFMNMCMFDQYVMKVYSKERKTNPDISFKEIHKREKGFGWRPFQIAFILINFEGIVNPAHSDREIVDLLWFPTGGGKTEAYLGLLAFTIAYRRLIRSSDDKYERDGGVTVILRYTLRLLTTQQRDRLLKMICAAERIRIMEAHKAKKNSRVPKFGEARFTVGFWVGQSTTPNTFAEFEDPTKRARENCAKQILTCPYCGEQLSYENYHEDTSKNTLEIKCSHEGCFYEKRSIPVYLIDEEIYVKGPTVIMSTVDKFASMPWKSDISMLFGKTKGKDRNGNYVPFGSKTAIKKPTREFYPPELIIQDELHLITGPLGTIYGGYETAIEKLCTYTENENEIKPKYIASTATIKNAESQVRSLYARENMMQFPPSGVTVGDSFFSREVSLEQKPFRKYVGISAPGQSMKTVLTRIYALLLQFTQKYDLEDMLDVIDPYRTLIGYYNSVRELGGAVMLLKDDIPARIKVINNREEYGRVRYFRQTELTSRINSNKIPSILERLETKSDNKKDFLDVAVATNMIAVGMDVDRLGMMAVTGQPKTTAEYIQATSRVGRKYPGLVFCIYNPYRPRDLSHYENFIPYHSSLYRYVEGTTATPFAARARDRVLIASVISVIRLGEEEMSKGTQAVNIGNIEDKINEVRKNLEKRVSIIQPDNVRETLLEFNAFMDQWKDEAQDKLYYYWRQAPQKGASNLMKDYGKKDGIHPILRSMRDVAQSVHLNLYVRGEEDEQ